MPKPIKTYIIRIEVKTRRLSKKEVKDMINSILLNSGIFKDYAKFKILNGEGRP